MDINIEVGVPERMVPSATIASKDKKIKICFLGDAGHINLISWCRAISNSAECEPNIVSFNKACEREDSFRVHLLKSKFSRLKLRYVLSIGSVRRMLKHLKPDLLIAYRISSYGFTAVNASSIPVVVIGQGSDLVFSNRLSMKKWLLRYVMKRADLVHVWAKHMAIQVEACGIERRKIFVMPKGIDDSVFCEYGKSNVDNLVRLISTRQLRKSYGHDIVLRAVARLRSGIPNIKYLICGDGEYRQELQKRVIELGLENIVTFLGRVDHSKLPLYLNSADVYVSMQASDGVSASLLEAAACGVFPVIPDNKANRLLIRDGLNGMLVSPDDEVGLAQGIEKALKDIHRRKKAKEMNSMFIKEKYSVISNTKLVLAKYRELVEKRV